MSHAAFLEVCQVYIHVAGCAFTNQPLETSVFLLLTAQGAHHSPLSYLTILKKPQKALTNYADISRTATND
jgi:hypothetical protein